MARAKAINPSVRDNGERVRRVLREAAVLLLLPVALYLFVCLVSYNVADRGWSNSGQPSMGVHNFGGVAGAWLADLLFNFFGVLAYAFPVLLGILSIGVLRGWRSADRSALEPTLRLIGFVAFFV
ncbi:MAG: cell division protein FtsK, partial [Rhodanobacteraceae bacterium]